jgi:hypothetical protein
MDSKSGGEEVGKATFWGAKCFGFRINNIQIQKTRLYVRAGGPNAPGRTS